jgi:hypothetical protein
MVWRRHGELYEMPVLTKPGLTNVTEHGIVAHEAHGLGAIGKGVSGDLALCGLIFADNLPQPQDFTLTVSVTVTKTAMTVDELRALSG